MSRTVIFANGEFGDPEAARQLVSPSDYVIGADGGTRHALSIGVDPDLIIGDLDSLPESELRRAKRSGAQVQAYSPAKDETDLELALKHAAVHGAREIIVLAALGGRLDQLIANVLLLALPELDGVAVRIVDGVQTAFLITKDARISGHPGDIVSLIPIGGDAAGVTTTGLEWCLTNDALCFGPARGVSNRLVCNQAAVAIRQGRLLCVVTRCDSDAVCQE
ncbi:MAG: thiamine diphosphokinase [Anaerolineae bacterium]|nr:thiamine diphosphokinase [Anaerolineae bacterium]